MTKVEHYVLDAINVANDDTHGYSMANRNGDPDYDCSSLVCFVVDRAGIPVRAAGAHYTGDMLDAFIKCGFKNIIDKVNINNGAGMKRGDVLLNEATHAALYIGDGKMVNAGGNDGHPEPGDQTGREIRVMSYWNGNWNAVLRYMGTEEFDGKDEPEAPEAELAEGMVYPRPDAPWAADSNNFDYPEILKFGDAGTVVQEMQAKLNALGYPCGKTDGYYGEKTLEAVTNFQTQKGCLIDGEAGPETLGKLAECYKALTGNDEAFYAQWEKPANDPKTEAKENVAGFYAGEKVEFIGGNAYLVPNGTVSKTYEAGEAKITALNAKAKHPIHLVFVRGAATKVYGWVDVESLKKI